jgi:hypothetical protein
MFDILFDFVGPLVVCAAIIYETGRVRNGQKQFSGSRQQFLEKYQRQLKFLGRAFLIGALISFGLALWPGDDDVADRIQKLISGILWATACLVTFGSRRKLADNGSWVSGGARGTRRNSTAERQLPMASAGEKERAGGPR